MFNTYFLSTGGGSSHSESNANASVTLNTPCTGFIQKSNPVSRFIRVKNNSREFENLFPSTFEHNPRIAVTSWKRRPMYASVEDISINFNDETKYRITKDEFGTQICHEKHVEEKEVIVLQMMVFGQGEFIVEYVFAEDIAPSETKTIAKTEESGKATMDPLMTQLSKKYDDIKH